MKHETKLNSVSRRSSGEMPSFSDTIFGFLDEDYPSSGTSTEEWAYDDYEEDDSSFNNQRKAYWEEQEKQINDILCRTGTIELKVRTATIEAITQLNGTVKCDCRSNVFEGCRDCLRQGVFDHLCNVGFICSIQKSKWISRRKIPSGEHTYLEVVEKSSSSNEEVKVIIELNFRVQFEMGRASEEYNNLIQKLPQVYVGKPERLRKMVKFLCSAAKKCMKDKKLHLAPWRRHDYMQSKWLNSYNVVIDSTTTTTTMTTTTATMSGIIVKFPVQKMKSRVSMLTQSLNEERPVSYRQTVKVL